MTEMMKTDPHLQSQVDICQRFVRLSSHEQQVISLLVGGMSNTQAARALGLSKRTIGTHLGNVLKKLQAKSNMELRDLFLRHALSTAP